MYPEKGPASQDTVTMPTKTWRELLAMSQIFSLVVQRLCFDVPDCAAALKSASHVSHQRCTTNHRSNTQALKKGLCLMLDVAAGAYFVSWLTQNHGDLCSSLLGSCLDVLRVS